MDFIKNSKSMWNFVSRTLFLKCMRGRSGSLIGKFQGQKTRYIGLVEPRKL